MLARVEMEDETDKGTAASRREPQRTCLATRENVPIEHMIRFVVAPDGAVVPDLARTLPGRGAWVSATRDAVERAVKEKAFARAFRGRGAATLALCELTEQLLERSALEALSLANKAGRIVAGNAKVESAILSGKVMALFHASDAARDGKRKLDGLLRRIAAEGGKKTPSFTLFTGGQLDLALGRPNVVHAALLASPASGGFLERSLRLERWRNGNSAGGSGVPGPGNDKSNLEEE